MIQTDLEMAGVVESKNVEGARCGSGRWKSTAQVGGGSERERSQHTTPESSVSERECSRPACGGDDFWPSVPGSASREARETGQSRVQKWRDWRGRPARRTLGRDQQRLAQNSVDACNKRRHDLRTRKAPRRRPQGKPRPHPCTPPLPLARTGAIRPGGRDGKAALIQAQDSLAPQAERRQWW